MAKSVDGQKANRALPQLRKLIEQYERAKADLRAKEQARRQAAQRTLQLRLRIEAMIQANDLDVFRAVYVAQRDEKTGRMTVQRLAAGKNLHLGDLLGKLAASSTGHGGDQTPECGQACDAAMEDAGSDPNWPGGACVCDCMMTDAGPMTVVTCPPPVQEPE